MSIATNDGGRVKCCSRYIYADCSSVRKESCFHNIRHDWSVYRRKRTCQWQRYSDSVQSLELQRRKVYFPCAILKVKFVCPFNPDVWRRRALPQTHKSARLQQKYPRVKLFVAKTRAKDIASKRQRFVYKHGLYRSPMNEKKLFFLEI